MIVKANQIEQPKTPKPQNPKTPRDFNFDIFDNSIEILTAANIIHGLKAGGKKFSVMLGRLPPYRCSKFSTSMSDLISSWYPEPKI